jgi:hypothetical protein
MPIVDTGTVKEGGMQSPWEPAGSREECWSDRESWRGDLHGEADEAWRDGSAESWEPASEDTEDADSWDGDRTSGWPEDLAGPEYWMYKDWE